MNSGSNSPAGASPKDIATVGAAAIPFAELKANNYAALRQLVGKATRVVCIGEETHGTHEFYHLRAEITKALIQHEGFTCVLCESDFPPFYKLNQYIGATAETGSSLPTARPLTSHPITTTQVMDVLKHRFPVWMWRNTVCRDFVSWLYDENKMNRGTLADPVTAPRRHEARTRIPVSLLGLDIYSMYTSADQVIAYLDRVDPTMAISARQRYGPLIHYSPHAEDYCRALARGEITSQHWQLEAMLHDITAKEQTYAPLLGDGDAYFSAAENARIVMAAEEYYREAYLGDALTWNIRDRAMVDMIVSALAYHDKKLGQPGTSRVIVWAHNSHLGDSAATQKEALKEVNVGHLVRELFGPHKSLLIGMSTYCGTVRAAKVWDGRDYVMEVLPSLPGSTGALLHAVATSSSPLLKGFGLVCRSNASSVPLSPVQIAATSVLSVPRLERFIGVQYIQRTERQSHYLTCTLAKQFDVVLHVDTTSALQPLPMDLNPAMHRPTDDGKWENFATWKSEEEEEDASIVKGDV